MDTMFQDLRYAARMLVRAPGFTAAAVLTLGFGIGGNTAMFGVVNAVLLRPLPFEEPDRLLRIQRGNSFPDLADLGAQGRSLAAIGGYRAHFFDLTDGPEAERVDGALVTGGLFGALRAKAALGRLIGESDDRPGGERVVVVSQGFWRSHLGGTPDVLGRKLGIAGRPHTVIGVMPAGFHLPQAPGELWAPLRVEAPQEAEARGAHSLMAVARLGAGVSVGQAQAELDTIATRLAALYPEENRDRRFILAGWQEYLVGDVRRTLLMLLGAVGFVLLIASTNVANLLLARAAGREREMAVRAALGAGRGRLVRQLLVEGLLLASVGGGLGLLLGAWLTDLIAALGQDLLPQLAAVTLDSRVIAFTAAVSLGTGLLFGLAPAWQASRPASQSALREAGRVVGRPSRLRSLLVVSEVALALVLLVGAGLLLRSFHALRSVAPGFETGSLLTFNLTLPMDRWREVPRRTQFFEAVLEKVAGLPGVTGAAATSQLPFGMGAAYHNLLIDGRPRIEPGREPEIHNRSISPGYFRVMGIPLQRGRALEAADQATTPPVGVINESMARAQFPGEDPLGRRVRWARGAGSPWITIVGVAADVKGDGLDAGDQPTVYTPMAQEQRAWKTWMNVVVRSAVDPATLVAAVRREVAQVDRSVPVTQVRTMQERLAGSLDDRRLILGALGAFAVLALFLAAVGINGVIGTLVGQRVREIGVRMALGATQKDVLRLVLRGGASLTLAGILLGALGAGALGRLLAGQLYEVRANDPATFLGVGALLFGVALVASWLPARRAARVDPAVALRSE